MNTSSPASPPAPPLAHQFDHPQQQAEAVLTGMWVFLASEVLFFGVLFFAYAVSRLHFPAAFAAAGRHTDLAAGSINTAVLLTSSYLMALAVAAIESRRWSDARRHLMGTWLLACVFIAIKAYEYHADFGHHFVPGAGFTFDAAQRQGAELFFYLYFVLTGIHAVHVLVGMGLIGWVIAGLGRAGQAGRFRRGPTLPMIGLYWHLVDTVWIFLYPLFYLVARS
jgi:cytochrome c oxidase subunit 3